MASAAAVALATALACGPAAAAQTPLPALTRCVDAEAAMLSAVDSSVAVAGTSFECLGPVLKGPLVLAFSKDDPGAAARVIKAFSKDNDKLVTTAVSLGGQLLGAKSLDQVASLPTREQALAMLMGVMRAPIQKLVGTLQAAPSKLVRTLAAVRDQKQAQAA